ncbi:MAG: hypothetical protein NTZ37_04980 [Methanoregula sp.]|nr:hypothetical protein [Methanoregula sp.]
MRPILWGVIAFAVGFMGIIAFRGGSAKELTVLFGIIFLFSLPIAIIAEIILWIQNRRKKIEKNPSSPSTIIKKEFPFQPEPLAILAGIMLILALYLLPIHTLIYNGKKAMTTSATLVSKCSGVGWDCSPYIGIAFYALWILGLVLIIFGIFKKKSASV